MPKKDGVVKYEVVYVDMIDDLVGGDGVAVGADVPIGEVVRKPLLGPSSQHRGHHSRHGNI